MLSFLYQIAIARIKGASIKDDTRILGFSTSLLPFVYFDRRIGLTPNALRGISCKRCLILLCAGNIDFKVVNYLINSDKTVTIIFSTGSIIVWQFVQYLTCVQASITCVIRAYVYASARTTPLYVCVPFGQPPSSAAYVLYGRPLTTLLKCESKKYCMQIGHNVRKSLIGIRQRRLPSPEDAVVACQHGY